MRAIALSLALSLVAAGGAFAQPVGNSLTLASADKAPAKPVIIDGSTWKCSGGVCLGTGGKSQPADRACRRVVAKIGEVTAFTWRGQTLSADDLAACNAASVAKK